MENAWNYATDRGIETSDGYKYVGNISTTCYESAQLGCVKVKHQHPFSNLTADGIMGLLDNWGPLAAVVDTSTPIF